MSTDYQVVEIAASKVLMYQDKGNWFWRGDDWTSHMRSLGGFSTREQAIENARSYFRTEGTSFDDGLTRR